MTTTAAEHVDPATLKKVIVAAAIGNFVEWFDFAVYGFLATTMPCSFPQRRQQRCAVENLRRVCRRLRIPAVGRGVFGMLGDRIGRKKTLAMTILLMAAPPR
ncbi:MFS transporter [Pseudomonas syringae pv. actinidiae]|nr:MFS transporter [Pseudomonas syringae pv. actinidiae]